MKTLLIAFFLLFSNITSNAQVLQSATTEQIVEKLAFPKGITRGQRNLEIKPKSIDLAINFDFDSITIDEASKPLLNSLARAMISERLKDLSFTVTGHTDAIGNENYNAQLSSRRANAVLNYLTKNGIKSDRLIAIGKGSSELLIAESPLSPENRRVTIRTSFENSEINSTKPIKETISEPHRGQSNLPTHNRRAITSIEELTLKEKTFQTSIETKGERHIDTMRAMIILIAAYRDLWKVNQQVTLMEKLLQIFTETLGQKNTTTIRVMNDLGFAYGQLGRMRDQLRMYEKSLELTTETLGERHPDTIISMKNLATCYGELGRHSEGLALQEKVLKISTETLGEKHPKTMSSMLSIASTLGELGRPEEHLALSKKILAHNIETLGENNLETLRNMMILASAYRKKGDTTEQLALVQKVVKGYTEILGERHPDTLSSLNNLAVTYSKLGKTSESIALHEKLLKLHVDIFGEEHPKTLTAESNLAIELSEAGRINEQLPVLENLFRIRMANQGERSLDTLSSIYNLARAYVKIGSISKAASLAKAYVNGVEWQRSQPGLSSENRQSVFAKYADDYRYFAITLALSGKPIEGFNLSELSKSRTLLESMTSNRAKISEVLLPADQEQLSVLAHQLEQIKKQILQTNDSFARQKLESQLNDHFRKYVSVENKIKSQNPKFAQLSDVKQIEISDLPRLVPENAIVISYLFHEETGGAYLIDTKGRIKYVYLDSTPYLAEATEALRLSLANEKGLSGAMRENNKLAWRLHNGSYRLLDSKTPMPAGASAVTDADEILIYLSNKLIKPLEADLQGKTSWIISPDGPLSQLPFEVLRLGNKSAIESAEIKYTQSISVFAISRELQIKYRGLHDRKSLFAMGNPEYAPSSKPTSTREKLRGSFKLRNFSQLRDLDNRWPNLPGTDREVKNVAALFPGSSSVYLKEQATEEMLQSLNEKGELKNYKYLLFSVHGYLSQDNPALSSIVLGQQNRKKDTDGYVTASELPGYNLRSDLVVLSACDSGLGDIVKGEGVMGLPFALFVAGNVNTILTLWPVDDDATSEFITNMFEKIKSGLNPTQALAATKREFINHKQFSNPRYWAPFVLIGAG